MGVQVSQPLPVKASQASMYINEGDKYLNDLICMAVIYNRRMRNSI
jgi:hypothetical protein